MRAYADKASRICDGLTEDDFWANEEKQLATVRAIEVIGEAAKGVPKSVRDLAPEIPWQQVVGMRDKLIHHYFGVDLGRVWRVVAEDLPTLKQQLDGLLKAITSPDGRSNTP